MPKNPIRVAAGKKSKRKGGRGNREAYKLFHRWFPDACKGDQSIGGAHCPDIDRVPWWVEVKFLRELAPSTWANAWNQATRDMVLSGGIKDVIVVARHNRGQWQVLGTAEFFYNLGYRGVNCIFQHKNLVDGVDLRRLKWCDFQDLLDKNYPVQTELQEVVSA